MGLNTGHDFFIYKKCLIINKNISKDVCKNIIGTYKRASNIIDQELKEKKKRCWDNQSRFLFKKMKKKIYIIK